jgi:hypothetical protein
MRKDVAGFFWDDTPPPKPPKAEKLKRQPPDPIWLDPSYLPGLEEAKRFPVHVMSIAELSMAAANREELIVDVESYPNYFLACFTSVQTGHVFYFESIAGVSKVDINLLTWVLMNFITIGFNSLSYDMPILYLAADGAEPHVLWVATKQIIQEEMRPTDVLRQHRAKVIKCDHIDLIEVAPLQASLKTYAGRLHAPKMQDLPFAPGTSLSFDQITIVRWYCVNDITNTAYLRECLRKHIELRVELSNEYKVDLRSKSDAQIAESVISHELQRITGTRPKRPTISPGTAYRYKVPAFIQYRSPLMNWALETIRRAQFVIDDTGSVVMPEEVAALKLDMNGSVYRMGIGGLHSSEKTTAHFTDKDFILFDKDVTSYYPFIILNLGLTPSHLGQPFLKVYRAILDRRIAAKRAKNGVVADSLKIVVNGSFGKLGSKWSILYAPDLMIQVTITGQLSLLMLIERLEYAGIHVVSGNTDGIVIKCPRHMQHVMDEVVAQWEQDTGFPTEETRYMALYSKDVNNYLAVKQTFDEERKVWIEKPDGTKGKGAYTNPWASTKNMAERLHKNPTATICVEAVCDYLSKGVPLEQTIRASKDIKKFVAVRAVKGGAVKVWDRIPPPDHNTQAELLHMAGFTTIAEDAWVAPGASDRSAMYGKDAYKVAVDMLSKPGRSEYIGKTVRWYYAKDVPGEIVYASNGNKVPRSNGAKPLMQLSGEFPDDVDFDWYLTEARRILVDIAAIKDEEAS